MLVKIDSPDNNRIKAVRKLQTKKGRDDAGKIVIEGINLVSEAVDRGVAIDYIMASEEYRDADFLQKLINDESCLVCIVPAKIMNKIADAENGIGIIAVIDKSVFEADDEELSKDSNVLVLDRVQDPGNIGTMIRTAVAAGYSMIYAIKGTCDVFSPKVLRSTAGMIFDIPFVYVDNANELRKILSNNGKRIVVTTVEGGRPYYSEDLSQGIALVIGNEGNGVSDEILDIADVRVTIPMNGNIESLNAAVSAAILMYEAVRK